MTNYKIRDYEGPTMSVASNEELVTLMREETPFIPAGDDASFMEALAKQIKMESGETVRSTDVDSFVEDLLMIGFLQQVEDVDKDKE